MASINIIYIGFLYPYQMDSLKLPFRSWWAFACMIPLIFAFDPYGLPEMFVGQSWLAAKIILLLVVACLAGMVRNEQVQPRLAARLCAAAWLIPAIIFSNTAGATIYLLPLSILAISQWIAPFPEAMEENPLSIIPDWLREWLSFSAMSIGVIIVVFALNVNSKDYFDSAYRIINYIPLFIGITFILFSLVIILTNMDQRKFVAATISSYTICLCLVCILTFTSKLINPDDLYIGEGIIISFVCSMLLVQVIRHFYRPDALLKVAETYVGGIIVAVAAAALLRLSDPADPASFFGILLFPALLVAVPAILFGLYLIWRKDVWLTRLRMNL